jgi:hypothetical protein
MAAGFKRALKDGVGAADYKAYKVVPHGQEAAIAYSIEKKTLYYLFQSDSEELDYSGDRLLDMAKIINHELKCFVSPAQKPNHFIAWDGPIYVYKFKMYEPPEGEVY